MPLREDRDVPTLENDGIHEGKERAAAGTEAGSIPMGCESLPRRLGDTISSGGKKTFTSPADNPDPKRRRVPPRCFLVLFFGGPSVSDEVQEDEGDEGDDNAWYGVDWVVEDPAEYDASPSSSPSNHPSSFILSTAAAAAALREGRSRRTLSTLLSIVDSPSSPRLLFPVTSDVLALRPPLRC